MTKVSKTDQLNDHYQRKEVVPMEHDSKAFEGRRVLITGASGGIGKACAQRFSSAGAEVILLDLPGERLEEAAEEVGGTALGLDLSDVGGLGDVAAPIDILIHNAGFQHIAPVERFPLDTFQKMIAVMLTAPFVLTKAVLPHMYEAGWGRVVHITSVHGNRASPYKSAYVAAKHGLEGLSKVVALEGGGRGVTSNCIAPAFVRTPLVDGQVADQARERGMEIQDVMEEVLLAKTSVKRLIEPSEVADAAAYLCSPAASFINGSCLNLDGGWTAQ